MKQPIFRHLDDKVEIFGFRPEELMLIASALVLFSEICRYFEISRAWGVGLSLGIALAYRFLRKMYGPHSAARLIRYASLPDKLKEERLRIKVRSK